MQRFRQMRRLDLFTPRPIRYGTGKFQDSVIGACQQIDMMKPFFACAAVWTVFWLPFIPGKNYPYPHHDDGVEVRNVLHKTRSIAIENFNEQFKAIFDVHGLVPTKGLAATRRFVLSAVFVYQLAILYCHLNNLDLRVGSKPHRIYVHTSIK